MLLDDVMLSHITGYVQPKKEWLKQVAVDYFNYNDVIANNVRYTVKEKLVEVHFDSIIIGNNKWSFANKMYLVRENGVLKQTGQSSIKFK